MISFQRNKDAEGYRYSLSYRTRYEGRTHGWVLEHWNGEQWMIVCYQATYAQIREFASWDTTQRAARVLAAK